MSQPLHIAIIGCGHWGPNHVRTFSALPNVRVVAAIDPDKSRLRSIGAAFPDLELHESADTVFQNPAIEAVVISVPTNLHYQLTLAALRGGKHVLVEKPLCRTSEEGEELVRVAKEAGKILMVGHVFLFNNGILKLKSYLKFNDLGKIYSVDSVRTNLGPIRRDVNVVYDLASHDISIFNFLLESRPTTVSAAGQSFLQPGIEDLAFITMQYPNDVLTHVQVSWLNPRKVREITIVGERKMLTWDDLAMTGPVKVYDKGVVREPYYQDYGEFHLLAREGDVTIPRVPLDEPLKNQARQFVEAVRNGVLTVSDGQFGLDVTCVLQSIQKSLEQNGAPVRVEYGRG